MSATSRPRMRLRREQRLRAGGDFVRLKNEGRRQIQGCLIFNWHLAGSGFRLGIVTGKSVGGAVVRNRARRLLREAFRRHQHDLALPVTAVLVARKSIVGRSFAQVETDFLRALRQAQLLKPAGNAPAAEAAAA